MRSIQTDEIRLEIQEIHLLRLPVVFRFTTAVGGLRGREWATFPAIDSVKLIDELE